MQDSLKDKLIREKIPVHVAIIMDGNGRWAAQHGTERRFGHEHGIESVRAAIEGAGEIGISYLTLYAFSTENWLRPADEVNALMSLLVYAIDSESENLNRNNVRLHVIGNVSELPPIVSDKLMISINTLKTNTGLNLILALSYSSKWEIVEAVRKISAQVKNGKIELSEIDDSLFESFLSTAGFPDPELLIRTSGEYRISNFLLWQIAYSELYFTDVLWPDFRKEHLYKAILDFQSRERRFGMTSEQLISK